MALEGFFKVLELKRAQRAHQELDKLRDELNGQRFENSKGNFRSGIRP